MPLLSKDKFIFIIGDEGTIFTHLRGTKILEKMFASTPAMTDRREINALITKNPDVPIYVILDTIEQTYNKHTLPAVSSFNIGKLVKKRLERDFAETDIKGALYFGRDNDGRKDWIYMFASTPLTSIISEWLEYIMSLSNKFVGIFMMPVEIQALTNKLNEALFPKNSEKKRSKWQIIVLNNKTSGFRQVILEDNKVVFTRLVPSGKDIIPDIVAGNIEQEVLNTIDYLRRLTYEDDNGIDVFTITSTEIKKGLKSTKIQGNDIIALTPFEISEKLGVEISVTEDDKFADLIVAQAFSNSKHVLKLSVPKLDIVNAFTNAFTGLNALIFVIVPVFVLLLLYNGYKIWDLKSNISDFEDEKATIEQKWNQAKTLGDYDIDEANKITNVVEIHDLLSTNYTPLKTVRTVYDASIEYAMVTSFNWQYINNSTDLGTEGQISTTFNFDLNQFENIDLLFSNYDSFSAQLKGAFGDKMNVDMSKLPEKITLQDQQQRINIQTRIVTKEDGKRRR